MVRRVVIRLALIGSALAVASIALAFLLLPRLVPGTQMLYISQPDFDQHVSLFLHDIERGVVIRARDDLLGWGLTADWSPDGDRIVFSSYHQNAAYRSLYIASAYGGPARQITRDDMDTNSPAWSPDGRWIAFQGVSGVANWDIYLHDLRTGDERRLTTELGRDGNPTWSPDGRYLAFESTLSGQGDLYVFDVQTDEIRQLTDTLTNESAAVWTPDGSALVTAVRYASGDFELWRVDARTGDMRLLLDDVDPYEPAISADGRWLAFMSSEPQRHIYLMPADGSGHPRRVTRGTSGYRQPSFRP